MTRSRRLILSAITVLPVLILLVASLIYLQDQLDKLSRRANAIIAGELERRFGKRVHVGSAQVSTPGTAVLNDVSIYKGPSAASDILVSAGKVVVRYNWRAILGGKAAGAVSEVDVSRPRIVLVRRANGTFNIADLLKTPPGPPKPPFRGVVRISGGEVAFTDLAVTPGVARPPLLLHNVNGSVQAAGYPVYAFAGTANGDPGQFRNARFSGKYYSREKRSVVTVNARGASAPLILPYAWKSKDVEVTAGKLDLAVRVAERSLDGRYKVTVAGTVGIRNATAALSFLDGPVTNVNGSVLVAPDRGSANLTALFRGTPVRVAGSFTDFSNPKVNLAISSNSADFRSLVASASFLRSLSGFQPAGRGPIFARVAGSPASPTVDVTASIPRASIEGVPVRGVRVSAAYRKGRVDIRSIRLVASGATVSASGHVAVGPPARISLSGQFSNLNLKLASRAAGYPVTGTAAGRFTLTGPTANPTASVVVQAENGSVAGTRFARASAIARVAGGRAEVSKLVVMGVAGGSLSATGTVSAGSLDLAVSAESISIGQISRRLGLTGYTGTAFLRNVRITGSPRAPQVSGVLEAFDVTAGEELIDYALMSFSGNKTAAKITDGVIRVYPAELRFTADLTGLNTSRITFTGTANIQDLEVAKLLDLVKRHVDVSGTILGDVTFSGVFLPRARRFVGLAGSGNVSLQDATAFGYPITSASAKLDYSSDLLRLSDAAVVSDGATLTLTDGTVNTATRAVNGSFHLSGFELSRLQERVGDHFALAGTASASGRISGSWDDVAISVDNVTAAGLNINYERFDEATAAFNYAHGKFETFNARLARGTQVFELTGTGFDTEALCFDSARGVVTDVSVPDVWDIVRASPSLAAPDVAGKLRQFPRITSGRVNGTFDLSGCLDQPDGHINMIATNIGIDVERIDSVELIASAKTGAVTLETFRVLSGDMTLEASGAPAYQNDTLNIEVRAENFKLARLEPWLKTSTPGGTMSALFTVQGAARAPDVIGSVEIVRPSYGRLVLDQLRASMIQLTPNKVEVPDILITAAGHQARASVSLPWDWSDLSVPKDEPLAISADLGRQSPTVLNILSPIVDPATTTAVISEAWFRLDGTWLDPVLSGSMKAIGGTIGFLGFTNTFGNVNVNLTAVNDRVLVNSFSAASSLGGTVRIIPGGYITSGLSGPSTVNLQVVADTLVVQEKNVLGLKEDAKTQIDVGLLVSGPVTAPLVADRAAGGTAGGITFSHGRLSFQLPSKGGQWSVLSAINPAFNVSLRLGQDVVIAPPNMTLTVTGSGTLTGTLANPVIRRMRLDVLSGDIALATARLRLVPGGRIYITYMPPAPPDVQVDLRATASVFAVNSLNQRQRYQITMTIMGQASAPQISLSSSPPGLTREQMLAGLGHLPGLFAAPEAGLQQELGNILTVAGATALFAPIENLFIEKLGFEQFSLEYSPMYPLSLYVSRQLFDSFYIAVSRQLRAALASTQNVWYTIYLIYRKGAWDYSVFVDDQQTLGAQVSFIRAFW